MNIKRQITTYSAVFFQFFNSPVALWNKKNLVPQEKVEMTPLLDLSELICTPLVFVDPSVSAYNVWGFRI